MNFQHWIDVLQTLILCLGLGATFWTLHKQKVESKARATLDLIFHQREDRYLKSAAYLVMQLKKKGSLIKYLDPAFVKERQAILKLLNFREIVAVGINQGIIDEKVYKQAFYTLTLNDWNNLKAVILELRIREHKNSLYQDFENLALRWEKCPLKKVM